MTSNLEKLHQRKFAHRDRFISLIQHSSITSLRSIQESGRLINDKKIPQPDCTHFSKQNDSAYESNQATNHRHANYRAINIGPWIGRIFLDNVARHKYSRPSSKNTIATHTQSPFNSKLGQFRARIRLLCTRWNLLCYV